MTAAPPNWEAEQLEASLARRVRTGWGAYWVARAQEPPPIPPIMLTGGIPDPDTLPIEELIEVSNGVLRREGAEALRYGGHQGYDGLRDWLASHYGEREGISLSAENFSITNGVSGAMINVCETFLDEGDVGLSEMPTFPGAAGAIGLCQGEIVGVEVDEEGLIPESLEATISNLRHDGRRVKLLYTVPNWQNPTGTQMTLARRNQVVDICHREGVLIVEDDAYGDIQFEGGRLPSLYAIAGGKGAVFMGTFSKTVATGLRVGWQMADASVIEALLHTRFDLGTSPWLQRALLEFAKEGMLDPHVAKMNDLYRRKRDLLVSALDERCSRYAQWNRPEGGYFLWLTLAPEVDPAALAEAARVEGVAYVGGPSFHLRRGGEQNIRLAFSFVNESEIPESVMRLGRAMERAATGPAK
jgi:DNA-binding transcriptional MocR family regulator